jgi:hypothetical protein
MYMDLLFYPYVVKMYKILFKSHEYNMNITNAMFVNNFEDMFEGSGLFKHPTTTYNNVGHVSTMTYVVDSASNSLCAYIMDRLLFFNMSWVKFLFVHLKNMLEPHIMYVRDSKTSPKMDTLACFHPFVMMT